MNVDVLSNGAPPCCARKSQPPSRFKRNLASAIGWLIPTATLALMPKCPACVAAYITAATGLGLSLSTAAHFRSASIVACVALLSATALMFAIRFRQIRRT